ncbi:hypothetical protein [Citrobacter sp. NCU1]|uniref:hypothetical protein n=1 Tax=Citrobacter sp. NCU1 TaxID=2026683 RepID=UPI00187760BE|nr:hypothetical protein [Citrobacter sp. NCU1]
MAAYLCFSCGCGHFFIFARVPYEYITREQTLRYYCPAYYRLFCPVCSKKQYVNVRISVDAGIQLGAIQFCWAPKSEAGKATGRLQIGCPAGIAAAMIFANRIVQNWNCQTVFMLFPLPGMVWWTQESNRLQQDKYINQNELDYIQAWQVVFVVLHAAQHNAKNAASLGRISGVRLLPSWVFSSRGRFCYPERGPTVCGVLQRLSPPRISSSFSP